MSASTNRRFLIKAYNHLYITFKTEFKGCVYCGGSIQCLDHAPPISLCPDIDIDKYLSTGGEFRLYDSCKECNSLLGTFEYCDLYLRLDHLLNKYIKKIDKIEHWDLSEIEELGYSLQNLALSSQYRLSELNNKIYNIDKRMLEVS